jgi:hypothetical protein
MAPIRRAMMFSYAAAIGDEALMETHFSALTKFAPDFIASVFRGESRLFAKDGHKDMLLDGFRKAGLAVGPFRVKSAIYDYHIIASVVGGRADVWPMQKTPSQSQPTTPRISAPRPPALSLCNNLLFSA